MEYFFATQPTSYSPSSSANSTIHNDGPPKDDFKATNKHSANRSGTARRGGSTGAASGVKLSTDPQSVAARERRHRISHRFKILQSLVPGGSKMDTVSMLEEAINHVKFLQAQLVLHQAIMNLDDDQDQVSSHQHPPAYVDTEDSSFPELRIAEYSVPPPEYSWFQGFDEEDNGARTSSSYGGCL